MDIGDNIDRGSYRSRGLSGHNRRKGQLISSAFYAPEYDMISLTFSTRRRIDHATTRSDRQLPFFLAFAEFPHLALLVPSFHRSIRRSHYHRSYLWTQDRPAHWYASRPCWRKLVLLGFQNAFRRESGQVSISRQS